MFPFEREIHKACPRHRPVQQKECQFVFNWPGATKKGGFQCLNPRFCEQERKSVRFPSLGEAAECYKFFTFMSLAWEQILLA
jgi:hypothetical protein